MNSGDLEHIERHAVERASELMHKLEMDYDPPDPGLTIAAANTYACIAIAAGQRLNRIGH